MGLPPLPQFLPHPFKFRLQSGFLFSFLAFSPHCFFSSCFFPSIIRLFPSPIILDAPFYKLIGDLGVLYPPVKYQQNLETSPDSDTLASIAPGKQSPPASVRVGGYKPQN